MKRRLPASSGRASRWPKRAGWRPRRGRSQRRLSRTRRPVGQHAGAPSATRPAVDLGARPVVLLEFARLRLLARAPRTGNPAGRAGRCGRHSGRVACGKETGSHKEAQKYTKKLGWRARRPCGPETSRSWPAGDAGALSDPLTSFAKGGCGLTSRRIARWRSPRTPWPQPPLPSPALPWRSSHAAMPTHQLPFVLVSRARSWSRGKTLAVATARWLGACGDQPACSAS